MRELSIQENAWKFNDREMKRLGIEYEGKGVLALRADLMYPPQKYGTESVRIYYYKKGESKPVYLENIENDRHFPNKNVLSAVMSVGGKQTKSFIPVVFDDISELYSIERIVVEWELYRKTPQEIFEYVIADHYVSFAKSEQKGVYGLCTYDMPFSELLHALHETREEIPIVPEGGKILFDDVFSVYDDICVLDTVANDEGEAVSTVLDYHAKGSDFDLDALTSDNTLALMAVQANANSANPNAFKHVPIVYYRTKDIVLSDNAVVDV